MITKLLGNVAKPDNSQTFFAKSLHKKTAMSNREEVLVLAKQGVYDGASFVRGKIYPGENICPWVVKRRGTMRSVCMAYELRPYLTSVLKFGRFFYLKVRKLKINSIFYHTN